MKGVVTERDLPLECQTTNQPLADMIRSSGGEYQGNCLGRMLVSI